MCAIEDILASWYDSNIEDTLFLAQENRYTASLFLYRLTPPSSDKFGQTSPLKRTAGLASSSLSPSIDNLQNAAKTKHPDSFYLAQKMWKRQVWAHLWILLHFPSSAKVKACCLILRKYETMGFETLAFLWLQFIWDKTYILYQITNALLIILARPLSFSLVAPWPPLLALRRLPRARNATDLLSQPILPTYVTHRAANTLPAHFSTPSEKSWELFQKVGWAGKGVVGLATIYVGGTLESPRWLDPLCFLRVLLHAAWGGLGPGQKY